MNAVIDQMLKHRSIRKYKNRDVPRELLDKCLRAGTMASSSGNMQAYSIIVTREPAVRHALFEPHFQQSMVLDAPVLLTFCADFHRMRKWLEISRAPANFDNFMSFMIAAIDAVLVSQNVALALESEGLGICYMGTTLASCEKIAEILKCPEHVVPVVGFSVGYPDEEPSERVRLPLKGLVHAETYQEYKTSDVQDIYQEREKLGWERYMSNAELREKVFELGAENLAQIYTKVKYTRESHIQYSETVRRCLVEKEFLAPTPEDSPAWA
ncbi:MAG: nitroreductase family protein [Bdellovibrionia bacterium]